MKFNRILVSILFFAFVLWVWNVPAVDLVSDDATYSFRALGYFDYLSSNEQTTPIQWLGNIPGWANLSFHDGPPLVFVIQKIFFVIFGDNNWGARLPFVFSAMATVYLVYLIGRQLASKRAGYLAAGLMAVLSFSVWTANTGYLEGIEIVFIALALYLWIKFLKTDKKKFLYWWGLALGLALITKYTAFFLVPLFILYALIYRRNIFRMKEFYLAVLIAVLVFTPVIIYNIQVYQTREHFDAAFSSLFGIETDDFLSLTGREVGLNLWQSCLSILQKLNKTFSFGVLAMFYLSIIYTGYLFFQKHKNDKSLNLVLASFILALLLLGLIGASSFRFLPILIPMIVIMVASLTDWVWRFMERRAVKLKKALIVFLILILAWEFFYNLNSNFLIKPISTNFLVYSENNISSRKLGFNKLDIYLREQVLPERLKLERPVPLIKIDERAAEFVDRNRLMYFFDDSISWFAHNWYFRKYSNYYGLPMVPFYAQAEVLKVANPIQFFSQLGVTDYYFIYGSDESVIDPKKIKAEQREAADKFANLLDQRGIVPVEIKNYSGQVAFKVYEFSLTEKSN